MNEKTHLDLFSGIGGFALAAKWNGYRTVGFCDNEPYAQAVLKKHWPEVPCHKDIREVRGELYAGVTLLTGGFPCQPFSVAGKQRGKDDNRYLWPEMLRVIQEAKPTWIIGENVAGIVNLALDQVCADLEGQGYEVEPIIVPACAVDAPHRRDRCWIIAKYMADSVSLSESSAHGSKEWGRVRGRQDEDISQRNEMGSNSSDSRENVADTVKQGREGRIYRRKDAERESVDGYAGCSGTTYGQSGEAIWLAEPNVGRVAHGIPNRTHRLKGLGNAIVPQVASEIIRCINKIMEDNK
jgi:DNA (cytosine-5)-methyltransferase 1